MRKISFSVGEYYHCYNRGTDKRKIFLTERDRMRFAVLLYVCNSQSPIHISNFESTPLLDLFDLSRGEPLVAVGAWALMPNHFHILLKEIREGGISLFMQKLAIGYTMYFNKKSERTGALLEATFKAEEIGKDNYLKYIFSYLHLNCIKLIDPKWKEKGLKDWKSSKKFLDSYIWSSYLDYVGANRPQSRILNRDAFPKYFQNPKEFDNEIKDWLTLTPDTAHGKT